MRKVTILIALCALAFVAYKLQSSAGTPDSNPHLAVAPVPTITPTLQGAVKGEKLNLGGFDQITPIPYPAKRLTPTSTSGEEEQQSNLAAMASPSATPTLTISETPPTATPLAFEPAELQALREIQQLGDNSASNSRIGGVRSGKDASAQLLYSPTPSPTPSGTPFERVSGQTRGYAMLYLMQPQARASVNKQIETLLRAEISDIYLGVLTDGTFGIDFAFLNDTLRRLSVDGRAVTLMLYLTNGATQRDWKNTAIDVAFNTIDPLVFRELIQYDFATRDRFSRLIKQVKPSFELNRTLSPRAVNIAAVMLEDNLDAESYRAMRNMAQIELAGLAKLIRNPCPGCYDGNDQSTQGEGLELHSPPQLNTLSDNDGFTLDGVSFRFPEEPPNGVPGVEVVKGMLDLALERRLRYFGLWRAERQGRSIGSVGGRIDHPEDRIYEIPTEDQIAVEIELLRHGLSPISGE